MQRFAIAVAVLASSVITVDARAESQVQIDGGLTVIGLGYEHTVAPHLALQGEAFVFGTYFLPWFDLGEDTKGVGVGVRGTWFANTDQHGLYVTPYVRVVSSDPQGFDLNGRGFTTGAFVGWDIGLSARLDLRLGAGVQYIRITFDDASGARTTNSTPFVALDATLGYRL